MRVMPVASWGLSRMTSYERPTHDRPVEPMQGVRDTEVWDNGDETAEKVAQTDGERGDEETKRCDLLHAFTELNQES